MSDNPKEWLAAARAELVKNGKVVGPAWGPAATVPADDGALYVRDGDKLVRLSDFDTGFIFGRMFEKSRQRS